MSENDSNKERIIIQPSQPEIQKGYDGQRSTNLSAEIGRVKEGYQPIVNITTTPPDGGSGVPDKKDK